MNQDFSRKMVIVARNDLESWQVLNAVAHCSAYLGNKIGESFDTGKYFVTKDGRNHPRNTQYAIVTLVAKNNQLPDLVEKVRKTGLLYLGFIKEMIETTNDSDIEQLLASKEDKDIEYLGVGLFGSKEEVDQLTRKFSLWK